MTTMFTASVSVYHSIPVSIFRTPVDWMFKLLLSMDTNFCAGISYKRWREVKKFYLSGKKKQIVKIQPTPTSVRKCFEMGLDKKTMKNRMIRIEPISGETDILVTSLTDMKKYPYEIFSELYHKRWPVKEDYKVMNTGLKLKFFPVRPLIPSIRVFMPKCFQKT